MIDELVQFMKDKGMDPEKADAFKGVWCQFVNKITRKNREHVGTQDRIISNIIRHEDNK